MKKIVLLFLVAAISSFASAQTKKTVPVKAPAKKVPALSADQLKQSIVRGKAVYAMYCLACHQPDGAGVPDLNPPLIKTTYVTGDKSRLINIILKGMEDEIVINGTTYGNPMPAHNFLKDQEIADVLSYIRNNFSNKASGVTVAEVKTERSKIK